MVKCVFLALFVSNLIFEEQDLSPMSSHCTIILRCSAIKPFFGVCVYVTTVYKDTSLRRYLSDCHIPIFTLGLVT